MTRFRSNLGMLLLACLLSLGMASAATPADASPPVDETTRESRDAVDRTGTPTPGSAPAPVEEPPAPIERAGPDASGDATGTSGPVASTLDAVPIPWVLSAGLLGAAAAIVSRDPRETGRGARASDRRAGDDTDPDANPDPARNGEEADDASAPVEMPDPGLDGLLCLGRRALDRGDLETAIGWFETAIAVDARLQAAHFCVGLCLDEMGRLEEAVDVLRQAHELAPEDPMTRYALASALARLGEGAEAIDLLGPLVRRSEMFADAMREDAEFDALRDHPRFLALTGELEPGPSWEPRDPDGPATGA